MREIPLYSSRFLGLVAVVDDEDFDLVCRYRWNVLQGPTGILYAHGRIRGPKVLMHRLILNLSCDIEVDHVDHNGLHNWRSNLRAATRSQNNANRRPNRGGTSQYKGVTWDSEAGRFMVQGRLDGKRKFIGRFVSELEAAKAYNKFALDCYGEFAFLNEV